MPVQELDVWLGNHRLLTLRQQHKIQKTTISMLHSSLSIVYLMKQQEKSVTNEKKQDTFIEYLSHADTVQDLHWPWVQTVKLNLIYVNPKASERQKIIIRKFNINKSNQHIHKEPKVPVSTSHDTNKSTKRYTKVMLCFMWYINTTVTLQANRFCGLLAVIQQCN